MVRDLNLHSLLHAQSCPSHRVTQAQGASFLPSEIGVTVIPVPSSRGAREAREKYYSRKVLGMCLSCYLSLSVAWRPSAGLAPHYWVMSSVQTSSLSKHEPLCSSEVLAVAILITAMAPTVTANPSQPPSRAFFSRFCVVCLPFFP